MVVKTLTRPYNLLFNLIGTYNAGLFPSKYICVVLTTWYNYHHHVLLEFHCCHYLLIYFGVGNHVEQTSFTSSASIASLGYPEILP